MTAKERRGFGPRNVPLPELTDAELLAEVERRRRSRGGAAPASDPEQQSSTQASPAPRAGETLRARSGSGIRRPRQVRQWLANLELEEDASLQDVEAAFARLNQRYAPAAQHTDAKQRSTAQLLLDALRSAYEGLRQHLLTSPEVDAPRGNGDRGPG